jgi:phosphatidate cytidylyltransferase
MTSSPPGKRFDWGNLRLRVISAAILGPVTAALLWFGGWPFLLLIAIASTLLAIEWALMSTPESPGRTAGLVSVAVLLPLFLAYRGETQMACIVLPVTSLAAAATARQLRWSDRSLDIAFGGLYLGLPGVTLLWLRHDPDGQGWAMTLLAATWAADIFAFIAGNVLKGPKLWPRFSPNKTWSGFFFGLAAAMTAASTVALLRFGEGGPGLAMAAPIGLAVGLATMAGDLWESILKRRFGVKDSGDLIPGHGGLLDRVDGLMFAVMVAALLRLALSANGAPMAQPVGL